ncbi:MAG: hypothetical protein ACFB22_11165 [Rhodothalassiaceae bacterium]
MAGLRRISVLILSLYIAFVFVQSLFFKFTNAAEPQHIFGTLNAWGEASFGISGLFAPTGPFSQYVVGTAELIASALLLAGFFLKKPLLQIAGAGLGLMIMTGAIFFHLFTPLGIVVENPATGVASDGGLLFFNACGVWLACALILYLKRGALTARGRRRVAA